MVFYNKDKTPLTIDLGERQYLDLDQQTVVGSLTLQPFTSKVLVDNGLAQLSLLGIQPSLAAAGEAQDFTLTLIGSGFTANSVVRWNGADRPTVYESSYRLSAAISAADVSYDWRLCGDGVGPGARPRWERKRGGDIPCCGCGI